MKKILPLIITGLLACVCVAQTRNHRARPEFTIPADCKHIGILPGAFNCFALTSGGIQEYQADSSHIIEVYMSQAIDSLLADKGFEPVAIPEHSADSALIDTITNMMNYVESVLHTTVYGDPCFTERVSDFNYSIGSIADFCDKNRLDAVLLYGGWDQNKTRRRQQMIEDVDAAVAVSASMGARAFVEIPEDQSFLSASLIDRDGRIIWYGYDRRTGEYNYADKEQAYQYIGQALSQFTRGAE